MKRSMGGGAHRGPVAHSRQRRTIRFIQGLLVVIAAALLFFAGYSAGKRSGFEAGARSDQAGPPRKPPVAQTVVLTVLGICGLAGALALQSGGGIRIPTPSRLDELAGRAESAAVQRAEELATEKNPT